MDQHSEASLAWLNCSLTSDIFASAVSGSRALKSPELAAASSKFSFSSLIEGWNEKNSSRLSVFLIVRYFLSRRDKIKPRVGRLNVKRHGEKARCRLSRLFGRWRNQSRPHGGDQNTAKNARRSRTGTCRGRVSPLIFSGVRRRSPVDPSGSIPDIFLMSHLVVGRRIRSCHCHRPRFRSAAASSDRRIGAERSTSPASLTLPTRMPRAQPGL